MTYSTADTQWALSAKGNWWRRLNGIPLIVGRRKDGRFWARRGDDFITGSFSSISEAKRCVEFGFASDSTNTDPASEHEEG